ncbi:MAG TPA: flagellar biosynthetic protein FliR [Haliangiales bacterium]|nr:flagellar biosynthetic protein FliR [Haliangiales bacterium]
MSITVVLTFLAIFVRGAAFAYSAPVVGDKGVPHKVRVALVAMVAFSLVPSREPVDAAALHYVVPGEILLGVLAGFTGRMILAAVEAGGELLGVQIGLGFAASYDPTLGESAAPTRRIAAALGALGFVLAGGLETSVRVMAAPPVTGLGALAATTNLVRLGGEVLGLGLRFVAPAMVAALAANAAVALASRAAPALNVFSVALALILIVVGAVLFATAPTFARDVGLVGRRAVDGILQVIR